MDNKFPPSKHKPTCPEFTQQPNAENGGFVFDTAFPCTCEEPQSKTETPASKWDPTRS